MDEKMLRPVKIEPMEPDQNWRAHFSTDIRRRVVEKIVNKLSNFMTASNPDAVNKINAMSRHFEEKVFNNATSKDNYINAIQNKMSAMEKSHPQKTSASSSNPGSTQTSMPLSSVAGSTQTSMPSSSVAGPTQTSMPKNFGHNSGLQDASGGLLLDHMGNSVVQGTVTNISPNTLMEIPDNKSSQNLAYPQQQVEQQMQDQRPQVQQQTQDQQRQVPQQSQCQQQLVQQSQHQLLKQNVQPNLISAGAPSNIHHYYQQQQQAHAVSQPSQHQISPQKMHQQQGRQNKVSEQRHLPLRQQTMSISPQQGQMTPQSNVSGVQQQRNAVRSQSPVSNLQSRQHSTYVRQQAGVTTSQQKVQQTLQPVQLPQHISGQRQSNSPVKGMQQRPESFGARSLQSSNDQQNQYQPQRVIPGSLQSSSDQQNQYEPQRVIPGSLKSFKDQQNQYQPQSVSPGSLQSFNCQHNQYQPQRVIPSSSQSSNDQQNQYQPHKIVSRSLQSSNDQQNQYQPQRLSPGSLQSSSGQHNQYQPQRVIPGSSQSSNDQQNQYQPQRVSLGNLQSSNDQHNQYQPHRVIPGASSDYSAPTEPENAADWNEQAYQKLQSMRNEYLPLLKAVYNRQKSKHEETSNPELRDKYKHNLIAIEKMVKFLSTPRNAISQWPKEKFSCHQHIIRKFMSSFLSNNSPTGEQHAQPFPQISSQSQASHLPQDGNVTPKCTTPATSVPSSPSGGSSFLPSPLSAILNSQMGLERRNTQSNLQAAMKPEGQNNVGSPQQTNLSLNARGNTFYFTTKSQSVQTQSRKQQIPPQWNLQKKPQIHQATSGQPQAISPQSYQHSSPQINQKISMSPLSEAGKPLHYATLPSVVASPSTPLTPSILLDSELWQTPPSSENVALSLEPVVSTKVDSQGQKLNGSPSIAATGTSPSHTDFTGHDHNVQEALQPIHRILKVLQSSSTEALSASVSEMKSAASAVDMFTETATGWGSKGTIGEDLIGGARGQMRAWSAHYSHPFVTRMGRNISAMTLDSLPTSNTETDVVMQTDDQIGNFQSIAASMIKKRKTEPSNALLDEINHMNQRLVETVIDVDSTPDCEGTVINCSYSVLSLDQDQKFPVLALRLLVPANYPQSSPMVLDELPVDASRCDEGSGDLLEKTKQRFNLSLRNLSSPMSVSVMARTWDASARAVVKKFAEQNGGGCFSSRYGTWESV